MAGAHRVDWQDRRHFLAVASRTMRRFLVDLVRAHATQKRGSQAVHVPLDSGIAAAGLAAVDLIALDAALEGLAALDPGKCRSLSSRFSPT
jgi:hypothetical protein